MWFYKANNGVGQIQEFTASLMVERGGTRWLVLLQRKMRGGDARCHGASGFSESATVSAVCSLFRYVPNGHECASNSRLADLRLDFPTSLAWG